MKQLLFQQLFKNKRLLGGRHSLMVPSAPTILRPWVRIPRTTSTLPLIQFKFELHCKMDENKQKKCRDLPHILTVKWIIYCRNIKKPLIRSPICFFLQDTYKFGWTFRQWACHTCYYSCVVVMEPFKAAKPWIDVGNMWANSRRANWENKFVFPFSTSILCIYLSHGSVDPPQVRMYM